MSRLHLRLCRRVGDASNWQRALSTIHAIADAPLDPLPAIVTVTVTTTVTVTVTVTATVVIVTVSVSR